MEKDNSKDESSNNDENRQNMTSDNNTHAEVDIPNQPSRTPFTNLSQVDADLALARTLQDQERAYMMLTMNRGGSDQESWENGSYVDDDDDDEYDQLNSDYDGSYAEEEEDAFDVHAERGNQGVEMDPASLSNDEAYARAIQDTEGQEMSARLRSHTRTNRMVTEEEEEDDFIDDHGDDSQGSWDDVDPDEMSYEELIALGEVVGTESRGLSVDSMASLRTVIYETKNGLNGSSETCVICRLDYEDGDNLILLSCKHSYHSECITNWLQINKVCPVCSTEVTTSSTAP